MSAAPHESGRVLRDRYEAADLFSSDAVLSSSPDVLVASSQQETIMTNDIRRTAEISACGLYRYWLEREWDGTKPALVVCMLNPSRGDADRDDPTIKTLIHFASLWGFGRLVIVNLYAWRASRPEDMFLSAERVGPENAARLDGALGLAASNGGKMLVAWGNDGGFERRDEQFSSRAAALGIDLICLGKTLSGAPKHPMARGRGRIARDQMPLEWGARP